MIYGATSKSKRSIGTIVRHGRVFPLAAASFLTMQRWTAGLQKWWGDPFKGRAYLLRDRLCRFFRGYDERRKLAAYMHRHVRAQYGVNTSLVAWPP